MKILSLGSFSCFMTVSAAPFFAKRGLPYIDDPIADEYQDLIAKDWYQQSQKDLQNLRKRNPQSSNHISEYWKNNNWGPIDKYANYQKRKAPWAVNYDWYQNPVYDFLYKDDFVDDEERLVDEPTMENVILRKRTGPSGKFDLDWLNHHMHQMTNDGFTGKVDYKKEKRGDFVDW